MVEENSQIQNHVTKVEITLKMKLEIAGKNPIEVTKTLDHTLGVKGDNYDWTITTTKDYNFDSLDTQIKNIMETLIFKFLNEKNVLKTPDRTSTTAMFAGAAPCIKGIRAGFAWSAPPNLLQHISPECLHPPIVAAPSG